MVEAANDNVSLTLRMYEDCKRLKIDPKNLDIDLSGTVNRLMFAGHLSVRGWEFMMMNRNPICKLMALAMKHGGEAYIVRKSA